MIARSEFDARVSEDWVEAIMSIAREWLTDREGRLEFETSEYPVITWVLSALQGLSNGYRLSFDTRQHTDLVWVEAIDVPTPAIGRGKCAFFTVDPTVQMKIEWLE